MNTDELIKALRLCATGSCYQITDDDGYPACGCDGVSGQAADTIESMQRESDKNAEWASKCEETNERLACENERLQRENDALKRDNNTLHDIGTENEAKLNAQPEELQRENDALREANRWIPVTEREPDDEDYTEKLVVTFEGYVTCATHVFGWRDGSDSSINITHWRPLPAPPEQEVTK